MNLSEVFTAVAALAVVVVFVWVFRAPSIGRLSGWISVPIAVAGVMSFFAMRTSDSWGVWLGCLVLVTITIGALGALIVLVFTRPEQEKRPAPSESIGPDIERIP